MNGSIHSIRPPVYVIFANTFFGWVRHLGTRYYPPKSSYAKYNPLRRGPFRRLLSSRVYARNYNYV